MLAIVTAVPFSAARRELPYASTRSPGSQSIQRVP
jgi:hypothetical protein